MTRALFGSVALLLTASPAARAQVTPPAPRHESSRFVAALHMSNSVFGDRAATTPAGGQEPTSAVVRRFGGLLGLERRIVDRWWLGGSVGWSQWLQGEGAYIYTLLDFTVAPRLELFRWSLPVLTTTLELALPFGLSKPSVDVPLRRAFVEQVESSWGWHAGGMLNVTLLFHHRRPSGLVGGLRFAGGYLRHASHRRTTFTPVDTSQAPIVEETDLVDQELLFMVAGVIAF